MSEAKELIIWISTFSAIFLAIFFIARHNNKREGYNSDSGEF